MGRVRQGIKIKKAKNKNAKYKAINSKYSYTKKTANNTTKKYAYTKKITLASGKTKYYYT